MLSKDSGFPPSSFLSRCTRTSSTGCLYIRSSVLLIPLFFIQTFLLREVLFNLPSFRFRSNHAFPHLTLIPFSLPDKCLFCQMSRSFFEFSRILSALTQTLTCPTLPRTLAPAPRLGRVSFYAPDFYNSSSVFLEHLCSSLSFPHEQYFWSTGSVRPLPTLSVYCLLASIEPPFSHVVLEGSSPLLPFKSVRRSAPCYPIVVFFLHCGKCLSRS